MKKKRLTTKERRAIPSKEFAGPKRSFPINDKNHARAALSMAHYAKNPSAIRAAVHRKFPDIGKKKKKKAVWDEAAYKRIRRKIFSLRKGV